MATIDDATTPPHAAAPGRSTPALLNLLGDAARDRDGRIALAGAALSLGLVGLIFGSNLRHFVFSWSTDENYSHGFLVPLISLYFANLAAERGPVRVRGGAALGVSLLSLALLAKLATTLIVMGTLGDLAFIAALAGLCALLAGAEALRRFWFAFAFLVFMVPLPVALYTMIANPLQLLVSQLASVVMNATGVPVLTEGNMMTLPGGVQMFVAEACSGMRQLTGFLALTAAVAYLAERPLWYRAAMVASAVPIAMTANVARVVLTGFIMYHVNPEYASGTYHTLEGLLMLGFGLSLLRAEGWVLDGLVELTAAAKAAETSDAPKPASAPAPTLPERGALPLPTVSARG